MHMGVNEGLQSRAGIMGNCRGPSGGRIDDTQGYLSIEMPPNPSPDYNVWLQWHKPHTVTEVTPAKIGTPCNPTLATASPACAQNQIILGFLRWPVSSGKENVT